jgi:sugar phosphate isomerase/epimerase
MTSATPLTDFSRLCLHTMTTRPWKLREAIDGYTRADVPAITVWRQALEPYGAAEAGRMLRGSGLRVVSLCRGGFFAARDGARRQAAIDDNLRAIDEARVIGAPLIVLVCGAVPGLPLAEAQRQIEDGIAAILPKAQAANVKLAIEPLHPMYADTRSAITTLKQANDIVERLNHPNLGVTVDVFHVWWDPELAMQIKRAAPWIFSFHTCDWKVEMSDMLNDRGLMGEGCIDLRGLRGMVEATGFAGAIEVEIFSNHYWALEQRQFVEQIKQAYLNHA